MLLPSGEKPSYDDEKTSGVQLDAIEELVEVSPSASLYKDTPEEKRLVRKIDTRLMPLICTLYLFAFLARTNLGNARLQGLPQDVLGGDPTGVLFDWLNSGFYFSYILCPVPAIIISKLYPPRYWMGFSALGWGLASTLMAAGFNFPGMMIARIFIGIFEACFSPGIAFYMSLWYTTHEIGVRLACYFDFAAVAGAFSGLIAFGIQNAHINISNWQLLFIVEGSPAILLGILSMWLLPDRPEESTYINENERKIQMERMNRGHKADVGRVVNKKHITAAFQDWRIYVAGIAFFGDNCALASIAGFLPTIIKTLGFTEAKAQLLTVPPYAVSVVVLTLCSYYSDRWQSRGIFMAFGSTLAGIGYLLLLVVQDNIRLRYFATFCITSGSYTAIGVILAWFAYNLGSETKKATGIPLYMAIGQCGSLLGSHIFPSKEGPQYVKGFAVCCALQFLAAICSLGLSLSYRMENKRRDRIFGKPDPDATVDTTELADKAPMFRYVP